MAVRKFVFSIGEWYHCFNRGVDKRVVFENRRDYERFLQLLFLANSKVAIHRSNLSNYSSEDIFRLPRPEPIVNIGVYSLIPNHFHLLIKEIVEGGITSFMQKLGTAYTMYFNIKHERTGNLFVKPFRSRHVNDDRYFQHAVHYIHCNAVELFEPGWKDGKVKNIRALVEKLTAYPYSSLPDFVGIDRPAKVILGSDIFSAARDFDIQDVLKDAVEYYRERVPEFVK